MNLRLNSSILDIKIAKIHVIVYITLSKHKSLNFFNEKLINFQ
jgi:hypothetical protein